MTEPLGAGGSWLICDSLNCLIDWLDHWQTFVSGIGAIGAAAVGVFFLQRQIASGERLEENRRARRLDASRALLPLSLSDTVHFANDSIKCLRKFLDATEGPQEELAQLSTLPRPVVPDQAILSFEKLIEATDDDLFASTIASMIQEMQVV